MKTNFYYLACIVLFIVGCNEFKKGEGGLLYKIHEDKSGETIKEGDMLAISSIQKTESDSIISSTYDIDNRPLITFRAKSSFNGDFNAALGMLSEGDSATIKVSVDSLIARQEISPDTKGKYIIYQIKVNKVVPRGNMSDSLYTAKYEVFRKEMADKHKTLEAGKIKRYLTENNLKPRATPSGLLYIITKQGNGIPAAIGDSVYANYTGMFLSGKPYMTTSKEIAKKAGIPADDLLRVPAGKAKLFDGLEEALLMFSKGTKATLIFPSKIAYKEFYHWGVEPYTPLRFDIEIVDILPAQRVVSENKSDTDRGNSNRL